MPHPETKIAGICIYCKGQVYAAADTQLFHFRTGNKFCGHGEGVITGRKIPSYFGNVATLPTTIKSK